jgi:hypothetical protein
MLTELSIKKLCSCCLKFNFIILGTKVSLAICKNNARANTGFPIIY